MNFYNKFKVNTFIALALILGSCTRGELPSSTFNLSTSSSSSSSSPSSSIGSSITTFTITWQNHDGTVLETDNNVPYGTTPTFNSSNPTKTSTDNYDYAFTGWLPAITLVTDNVTYVAQFSKILNYVPITTAQELSNIRNNLTATYKLMNDIDLESAEWQPIGTASTPFSGTFNGNEFTISNLTITQTQAYVGLFANNSGTIKNLKLGNVQINVSGSNSSFIYAGSIVAKNTGIIENIETTSGFLFAVARGGNIGILGGLIGLHNHNTTLDKLINNINVSGENPTNMGGIIGSTNSTTTITNSINSGSVRGRRYVGGIIGSTFLPTTITNSVNIGSVTGQNEIGGLVGYGGNSTSVTNSVNIGSVTGQNYIGGLLGVGGNESTITNSVNSGSVTGQKYAGGLIGAGSNTTMNNSVNSGSVRGTSNVGGLLGIGWSITIINSVNSGSVRGASNVGGLIGYRWTSGTTTITNSINSGNVSLTENIGGLIRRGEIYY